MCVGGEGGTAIRRQCPHCQWGHAGPHLAHAPGLQPRRQVRAGPGAKPPSRAAVRARTPTRGPARCRDAGTRARAPGRRTPLGLRPARASGRSALCSLSPPGAPTLLLPLPPRPHRSSPRPAASRAPFSPAARRARAPLAAPSPHPRRQVGSLAEDGAGGTEVLAASPRPSLTFVASPAHPPGARHSGRWALKPARCGRCVSGGPRGRAGGSRSCQGPRTRPTAAPANPARWPRPGLCGPGTEAPRSVSRRTNRKRGAGPGEGARGRSGAGTRARTS